MCDLRATLRGASTIPLYPSTSDIRHLYANGLNAFSTALWSTPIFHFFFVVCFVFGMCSCCENYFAWVVEGLGNVGVGWKFYDEVVGCVMVFGVD